MKNIHSRLAFCTVLAFMLSSCTSPVMVKRDAEREKTAFQTNTPWKETLDNRADIAIVYGMDETPEMSFEQRMQSWKDRGYRIHYMSGIAWGGYHDYFMGKWDGVSHFDEAQVTQSGDTLWHGRPVPYLVPTKKFIRYMQEKVVKRVIDAGIDAIYLEEPEYWAHAGYSDAFKREWKDFYGFDWKPQHESAENTYLSNKLKYHLYYRALDEVFSYAKAYGKTKGMDIRCYVPTHSLVNYSAWSIVSPEASLASLSCVDGYIAQVWTGTSRTPNYYNGVKAERVFENAFLEYGSMESMTEPTHRKLYFLTDPIEDWPRDWNDYKVNYQATFTAQLLYPKIANYEVMPWPDRIYEGLFLNPKTGNRERISRDYSTQMQVMINALGMMPVSDNKVSGSDGVFVMMSNSLMFQRGAVHKGYDDSDFSNFYGQTMPLVKRGVPVRIMHLENVSYPETWKDAKVVVLSYANMKPMDPEAHKHIAEWVKQGGNLVYCAQDKDPYQQVLEWWNQKGNNYLSPSGHLFEQMGMKPDAAAGEYRYGKGAVRIIREDPKGFVLQADADKEYIQAVREMYERGGDAGKLLFKNSFYLERGPYEIAAVIDDGIDNTPLVLEGRFINLFDTSLPVVSKFVVEPGKQALLYNIDKVENPEVPQVLAAAARVEEETIDNNTYTVVMKSPKETTNVMRVLLPAQPSVVQILDTDGNSMREMEFTWDEVSKTCFLKFENSPEGVRVRFVLN
ncbi:hypothetical protein [Bacteroides sp.]|uniref:hypothetical protein n=1 Tax=Bacteroides sp. TaxID=29523 RepID=UPI002637DB07|nr:hypothetical protein [Bacteroides sp.]